MQAFFQGKDKDIRKRWKQLDLTILILLSADEARQTALTPDAPE